MATQHAAYRYASDHAKKDRKWLYVVWSVEDQDAPGQHYHVGNEQAVDTFYAGAEVVACFGPDGSQESN